jgi:hypothetical protein
MKKNLLLLLPLAVLTTAGCWSTLLPGRCDKTSDCGAGLVCNLDPTPQGNGTCVSPTDGSVPDGAAGGAGEGGVAGAGSDAGGTGGTSGTGAAGHDAGAGSGGPDASMEVAPEVKPGCTSSTECPVSTPICDAGGACRPCDAGTVSATACATLDASKPTCGANGQCVVCATSADCKADPTKPICDVANQKCIACTADRQCADKLGANPGVCMAHQDGRCATDAETFYVSSQTGCSDTGTNAGTSSMPFCTLDPAASAAGGTKSTVVVRGAVTAVAAAFGGSAEISVIGQQSGVVVSVGTSTLHVEPGKRLYVRALSVTAAAGVGIIADGMSTLRLERVTVSNSAKGGIHLAGASFDISNSTITGNGPGFDGAISWGGIYVQFPPTSGLSQLALMSITNNKAVGITCTGGITGSGVLASANSGGIDINPTCGFAPCATANATCGAQP